MLKIKDPEKSKAFTRAAMYVLLAALLSLVLIMPLRGIMNAVSRFDFIAQRLDDYPRMYSNYLQETDEWWNWWMTEDYARRAEQAAVIYQVDDKDRTYREKLEYIRQTLNAKTIRIVSAGEAAARESADEADSVYYTTLKDGRKIELDFGSSLRDERLAFREDPDYFKSRLQAGLPGYVAIIRNGELSIYPKDENNEAILSMLRMMLENGKLNREALTEEAKTTGKKAALKLTVNQGTDDIPAGRYFLYSAAYADSDDFVVNVAEVSSLVRFGRKRSWSLWALFCAVVVLLAKCLWKTKLYIPGEAPEEGITAVRRSYSAFILVGFLILGSVTVIQLLSSVNLSQQGATDQAEFMKRILAQESARAMNIEKEFDGMYSARVSTAATILSDNPEHIDVDTLYNLDRAMDGSGLRVYDMEGNCIASDDVMHQNVEKSIAGIGTGEASAEENGQKLRFYRTGIRDENGGTIGWLELSAAQDQLDSLLYDTSLREVVGDLHILDTLHVVIAEGGEDGRIVASTWSKWVGEKAEEHGISPVLIYDGYEGIVKFEDNKCYSVVFSYDGKYVIVGSDDESMLVFIGGVALISLLLLLIALLIVYRPVSRLFCNYQKQLTAVSPEEPEYKEKRDYPPLWEYTGDFMVAVCLLSTILFFTTKGNPAGLTYNIVRGTWVRGVNAATITTSIMLASLVFALQRLIDRFLVQISRYLSPKGKTICRLLDSCLAYLGAIVLIIYALSMFGVETRTLIGGVGLTAVIFTLGTNSLLGDVIAGIFIIFEGDFTVGDVVVIDDFRGIVTDIGIRTTKLMDDNTRDIKIVNNSEIKTLINQSREKSAIIFDIPISPKVGIENAEKILQEAIVKLPEQFPEIIGTPQYWGVSELPKRNLYTEHFGGPMARIALDCGEMDKEMLTYKVYRALMQQVNEVNNAAPPEAGDMGKNETENIPDNAQ